MTPKLAGQGRNLVTIRLHSQTQKKAKAGRNKMHIGTAEFTKEVTAVTVAESGICAGTTIMTLDGEMPVEHLVEGARVITRDSGMAILRKVETRNAKVSPIRIKSGSLGHTRPDRDMMVSPGARIHIRDWRAEALFGAKAASVVAERLVDGEFLAAQNSREMPVYTLRFDKEHIIYADGVELLSDKL
jgi:hypothetical protein